MIWLWLLGCGGGGASTVDTTPDPIGYDECVVCGMVVSEQPPPRGQAIHRDGTHAFACSLGDLRAFLQAPSPLGPPVAVYVEALGDDLDAQGPLPWVAAASATYVSGVDRPLVMGVPLLSYADRAAAERAAATHGGTVHDWVSVSATPFSEPPR